MTDATIQKVSKHESIKDADQRVAAQILHNMTLALYQLRLYQVENSTILQCVDTIHTFSQMLLSTYRTFSIGISNGKILINGEVFKPTAEERTWIPGVVESLNALDLKSLSVQQGLTPEEWLALIKVLAKPRKGKDASTATITSDQFPHLTVNAETYVAVGSTDIVVEQGMELLDRSGADAGDVIASLTRAAELATKSGDPETKTKAVDLVAKRLAQLDAKSLIALLEKEMPIEIEQAIRDGLATLPIPQMKEIASKMIKEYQEAKSQMPPGSATSADLVRMKGLFKRFALWIENKSASLDLYQMLLEQQALELAPPEWETPQPSATPTPTTDAPPLDLMTKVRNVMEGDELALLASDNASLVPEMAKELESRGNRDVLRSLVGRMATATKLPDRRAREEAARMLTTTLGELKKSGSREIVRNALTHVIDAEDAFSTPAAYEEAARLLKEEIIQAVMEHRHRDSVPLIGFLQRHRLAPGPFPQRSVIAEKFLGELTGSSPLIEQLAHDLSTPAHQEGAFEMLVKLGQNVVPETVRLIGQTEDGATRKMLALIINHLGTSTISQVVQLLRSDMPVESLRRVMEIMTLWEPKSYVHTAMESLASHFDSRIRRQAMVLTAQSAHPQPATLVVQGLKDGHAYVRMEAARTAGLLKVTEAVPLLHEIVRTKSVMAKEDEQFIQVEACVSLGLIGDPRSAEVLFGAAKLPMFSTFFRAKDQTIRGAAIEALAHFKTPQAKKLLEQCGRSKDHIIRQAAERALQRFNAPTN